MQKKTNYLIRAHFLELFSSLLTRLLHLNKKSIQLFIIMFMSYIVFSCVRVHSMSAYICRHFSVPSCGQKNERELNFEKLCSFECICACLTHFVFYIFSVHDVSCQCEPFPIFSFQFHIKYQESEKEWQKKPTPSINNME